MMPAGQQIPQEAPGSANGQSTLHDLFALTDEQILEIEPDAPDVAPVEQPLLAVPEQRQEAGSTKFAPDPNSIATSPRSIENMQQRAQARVPVPQEPPAWLAAQMKDPWSGEEARELWNGVQQARQEAAAYRAAFATPEDARALKELYPGGVNEARAAANRARLLDQIDNAYFGAAGKSAEESTAARVQLAQMMLHEDPTAFREMVFAGLRALENSSSPVGPTLASPRTGGAGTSTGGASSARTAPSVVGAQHPDNVGTGAAPQLSSTSAHEAHAAAYAAFEKAANEDLERSVGSAIARTIEQALPNVTRTANNSAVGAQHPDRVGTGAAPLQDRLAGAIRQDVEAALKGDRQLGEQIAQILSARRFDNEARAQVVRLIGERAQQLVPVAAKRVLNDWTQATLAAHRGNAARAEAASARREVAPAASSRVSAQAATRERSAERNLSTNRTRPVDYRKLSDEQILEL